MSALLNCPFCGAELESPRWDVFIHPKSDCLMSGFMVAKTHIDIWNRRTPPPLPLPTREEVAKVACESGLGKKGLCMSPRCAADSDLCPTAKRIADAVLRLLDGKR
jgi:hypothetical protein